MNIDITSDTETIETEKTYVVVVRMYLDDGTPFGMQAVIIDKETGEQIST